MHLQRKKFRRVHGNVLDSDEEDDEGARFSQHQQHPARENSEGRADVRTTREESRDSSMHDEDFANVRHWHA